MRGIRMSRGCSPYLRHRLITEEEVLTATLGRFSLGSAEKFVQEVCWRTYWKGWLELRPAVWAAYRRELDTVLEGADAALTERLTAAEAGRTGIGLFRRLGARAGDDGLPCTTTRGCGSPRSGFSPCACPGRPGPIFFLRHLLDGDPASNTLGWRWVAGVADTGQALPRPARQHRALHQGTVRAPGPRDRRRPVWPGRRTRSAAPRLSGTRR